MPAVEIEFAVEAAVVPEAQAVAETVAVVSA